MGQPPKKKEKGNKGATERRFGFGIEPLVLVESSMGDHSGKLHIGECLAEKKNTGAMRQKHRTDREHEPGRTNAAWQVNSNMCRMVR